MALLHTLLVDAQMRDDARLAPLKAAVDRSIHDRIDLAPTDRQKARNAGHGHFEQQGDGQAFGFGLRRLILTGAASPPASYVSRKR